MAETGGRGSIDGLVNPRPIGREMPALLQEDAFCLRLTGGFDELIAPVFATLDCWDSYLDPDIAPEDFVNWLAGWVGVEVDENWSIERRRNLLQEIVALYRIRGTAAGLASHVYLYCGAHPEILENGGCLWSQTADTPLPGSADPHLSVRLRVSEPEAINRLTVDRIVAASRPAHLVYTVEIGGAEGDLVLTSEPGGNTADGGEDAPGAVDLPRSPRVHLAAPGPQRHGFEQSPDAEVQQEKPSE